MDICHMLVQKMYFCKELSLKILATFLFLLEVPPQDQEQLDVEELGSQLEWIIGSNE
jgi:hypothetical protein